MVIWGMTYLERYRSDNLGWGDLGNEVFGGIILKTGTVELVLL